MPVINRVADLHDEITAWRRDFHENPELLYDVHRTAGIVAEKLKAFGVRIRSRVVRSHEALRAPTARLVVRVVRAVSALRARI